MEKDTKKGRIGVRCNLQFVICKAEARLLSICATARNEILISEGQIACQNITSL